LKVLLVGALLASGGAAAAPAPRLVPDRDVTIEYRVTPQDRAPVDVVVAVAAGGRFLHITSQDLPTTILVNRDTETAAILLPVLRAYAELRIGRFDPERTVLRGAAFSRAGERMVAGRRCIEWRALSRDGQAAACITPDGVILRGAASSGGNGEMGSIEARRVVYGPLSPDLFTVPPDFRKSPIPFDAEGGQ
jgi:hypothetical protein